MAIIFYPNIDDIQDSAPPNEKLEILLEAAERYKAIILEMSVQTTNPTNDQKKRSVPRDIAHSFNWEELTKLLSALRQLPENNASSRTLKADYLAKLAEVYEVLRGAKMPKLEAVRLALMNEANQLRNSTAA